MRRTAFFLNIGVFVFAFVGAAAQEAVDLELVLAADGSGSIDDDEMRLQRSGYAAAITHPSVLKAIRSGYRQAIAVAYVEWGAPESQHTIVDWSVIRDEESARTFAAKLIHTPRAAYGFNSISNAIHYSAELIRSNAYKGERAIIDVSGDGPQMGGRLLELVRAETVASGITINALVIDTPGGGYPGPSGEPLADHYRNDVIGGFRSFVMVAENRRNFAHAILRKLILEIASREPGPADL
jgi:hypothetical protein